MRKPNVFSTGHILVLEEVGEDIETIWTGPGSLQEIVVCPAMVKDHTQKSIIRATSILGANANATDVV